MYKTILIILMSFSMIAFTFGQDGEELSEKEKLLFTTYIVPSPHEVFVALGNLDNRNWNELVSYVRSDKSKSGNSYKTSQVIAMNLGVRVADGFLGVIAKEADLVYEMGLEVKTLSERLGVNRSLIDLGETIESLAKEEKWGELVEKLNEVRDKVYEEMFSLRDRDSAILGSYTCWLEGLHLISKSLTDSYDAEATQILRQQGLIAYLKRDLENLTDKTKSKPLIMRLIRSMKKIEKLCDIERDETIPKADIEKLYKISSDLVKKIQRSE